MCLYPQVFDWGLQLLGHFPGFPVEGRDCVSAKPELRRENLTAGLRRRWNMCSTDEGCIFVYELWRHVSGLFWAFSLRYVVVILEASGAVCTSFVLRFVLPNIWVFSTLVVN